MVAATPVLASTGHSFVLLPAIKHRKSSVFPVPAAPVKKTLSLPKSKCSAFAWHVVNRNVEVGLTVDYHTPDFCRGNGICVWANVFTYFVMLIHAESDQSIFLML